MLLLALAAQADDVHRVSDREGFINALGSNRTIVVEEGAKILLCAEDEYPEWDPGPYASWESNFDGSSLVIRDVENLVITGEGYRESSLVVEPRYVFVLDLQNCRGVSIENLNLGHTTGGYCDSGVLGIHHCRDISVTGSFLYGCGTEGITMGNSSNVVISGTDIAQCTYGIMTCRGSREILFQNCLFRDNREYYGVELMGCSGVEFTGCIFRNCFCDFTRGFISSDSPGEIRVEECFFQHIVCPELFAGEGFVLQGNTFFHVEELNGM